MRNTSQIPVYAMRDAKTFVISFAATKSILHTHKICFRHTNSFRKIKNSKTHSNRWYNGMKRSKRSLAENRSQRFRGAGQRLCRIYIHPYSDKTEASHNARVDKGTPIHAEFLFHHRVDKVQNNGGHDPNDSRRLSPFRSTGQIIKILNER